MHGMTLRTRKLVGSIVLFIWMVVFALLAMAAIAMLPARMPVWVEPIVYCILGVAWIAPLKPLFIWMGKGRDTSTTDTGAQ
jgi:uncharacterized membrane-anchored protein